MKLRDVTSQDLAQGRFSCALAMKNLLGAEVAMGKVGTVGRVGDVEEVSPAVAFVGSSAGSLLTGQVLPVDGGWVAW